MVEHTPENTYYRDKRVCDMTREELMDALVDVTRRIESIYQNHRRTEEKMRKLREVRR